MPDSIDLMAQSDFESARRKSFWRAIASWLTGSSNDLLPYSEVRKHIPMGGQRDIGLQQVAVDRIVGSVGRYHDFDRAFLPRFAYTSNRWMDIDRAQLQDIILPPVELYKIGDAYFVRDGNHRVSVARERGQFYIDAYVTEIDSPIPIRPDTDIDEIIRKKEQAEFLVHSGLSDIPGGAQVELTLPGGYDKLLEHIQTHHWFMGIERKQPVPWEEAVRSWFNEVYLPLVKVIRESNILKKFPGRSETDLYLWVIEHLYYLREEYADVTLEEAVEHFASQYAEDPLSRLFQVIRNAARLLIPPDEEKDSTNYDIPPDTLHLP